MRIIDSNGKRIVDESKSIDQTLKKTDPIKRNAEKDLGLEEHSPMDPPSVYDGAVKDVDSGEMNSFLKRYMEEHKAAIVKIDEFENALAQFKEAGYQLNNDINNTFSNFFQYFDNSLLDHNRHEERLLFPLLHQRLIESGESGQGHDPHTAVDMMEDDHIKFIQLGALTFNMLGLAARLPDERSRMFVYDTAYNSGRELTEILRLHIYREDNIVFPLAHKLISKEEFSQLNTGTKNGDEK